VFFTTSTCANFISLVKNTNEEMDNIHAMVGVVTNSIFNKNLILMMKTNKGMLIKR